MSQKIRNSIIQVGTAVKKLVVYGDALLGVRLMVLWSLTPKRSNFMRNTNPKQFRAELKDYLDMAAKEPIRIQRRSGENFILLKEEMFQGLQEEIVSLQRRLLGMSQVITGETKEYKIGDKSRMDRLKRKK